MTYKQFERCLGERDIIRTDEGSYWPTRPVSAQSLYTDLNDYVETEDGSNKLEAMSDDEILNLFIYWHEEMGCTYFQTCWIIGSRLDGKDVDEDDSWEL